MGDLDEDWDTKESWNQRYAAEKLEQGPKNPREGKIRTFDWHQSYDKLGELFAQFKVAPGKIVSVLGCGNSKLPEEMAENGFTSITAVDWSDVVIDKMRDRCSGLPISWYNMDVTDAAAMSQIPDNSQDVVIDKALFDCMMSYEDSTKAIVKYLHQVQRILHNGGVYILVSHGSKDSRMWYLKHSKLRPWKVEEDLSQEDGIYRVDLEPLSLDHKAKSGYEHRVFICTFY